MKGLITTYHNSINFGAALQSYALQQTLTKIGVENKLLLMESKKKKTKYNVKNFVKSRLNGLYNLVHAKKIAVGQKRFLDFFENWHNSTDKYKSFDELLKNPPKADAYISGSDQVFNPISLNPAFFLQFGDKETKRISYAASLGVKKIPEGKKEEFKRFVDVFDKISLREKMAVEEFEKVTGITPEVNIDPSFLLSKDEWKSVESDLCAKEIKKPYILVYAIYNPKWLSKTLFDLNKKTGYEIVLVSYKGFPTIYHNKCVMTAGPREFLGLIQNAKMVISSSFHGNVFAMIYKKPFYAVVNPDAPDRIMSLLKLFRMEERQIKPTDKAEEMNFSIDYAGFDKILEAETKRSEDYLKNTLFGE